MNDYVRISLSAACACFFGGLVWDQLLDLSGFPAAPLPPGAVTEWIPPLRVAAALCLGFGVAPLALRLRGSRIQRWAALSLFLFVTVALNTNIEVLVFSTLFAAGGFAAALIRASVPLVAAAAVFAAARQPDGMRLQPRLTPLRLLVAWMSFPVIYLVFGMAAGPVVIRYYENGGMGWLLLPAMTTVLQTQLVRSAIYLISVIPVLMLLAGERKPALAALAAALFSAIGLFGLVQSTWFPLPMLTAHTVEILGDCATYAIALFWLLLPVRKANAAHSVQAGYTT